MKKSMNIKRVFIVLLMLVFIANIAHAISNETVYLKSENVIEVNFFYSMTCPHCAKEGKFLDELEKRYPQVTFNRYPVEDKENLELMRQFCIEHNIERYFGVVPLTFVNGDFFIGFDNPEGIGKEIEESIQDHLAGLRDREKKISLPFFGGIDLASYSLPLLSIILGFFDGFNVCSMGALVLILSMVLIFKSRKKVLMVGGTYILTTSIIYGILMIFWYGVFSLMSPYLRAMQILMGVIGIAGGAYFFNQFIKFRKYGPTCEMGFGKNLLSKFSTKFHQISEKAGVVNLIISVLMFAIIITVVEFPCSAVIPVFFIGILTTAQLHTLQYFFYLAIYLFFYMLIEITVFLIAFFTLKVKFASSNFNTWVTLATSILLFLLGFYYLIGL